MRTETDTSVDSNDASDEHMSSPTSSEPLISTTNAINGHKQRVLPPPPAAVEDGAGTQRFSSSHSSLKNFWVKADFIINSIDKYFL